MISQMLVTVSDIPDNAKEYIVAQDINGQLIYLDSFEDEIEARYFADLTNCVFCERRKKDGRRTGNVK